LQRWRFKPRSIYVEYFIKKETVPEEMLIPVFQFYIASNYSNNDPYLSLTVPEVHSTE